MNQCFIIGNLTKAPEARTTPNGISVTTFTVAVARRFDRNQTDFFNVVTWRGLADNCGRYLVKGQKVAVTGELQTRSYDGKDGVKRYVTELIADNVEFLSKPAGAGGSAEANPYQYPPEPPKVDEDDLFATGMDDIMDDEELPF